MSKRSMDPLYPAARRVLRQLGQSALGALGVRRRQLDSLADVCAAVCRARDRIALAQHRGWDLAAGRLGSELLDRLGCLQTAARSVSEQCGRQDRFVPPLPLLLAELRQLRDEFEHVAIDSDNDGEDRIRVETDPIVLEGLSLGRFSIELLVRQLGERLDPSCFRCLALEPNVSQANEFVTHPHVSDGGLCAGDATVPIALALQEGRLCDAFLTVRSVLSHYNPGSAYVRIEDWDGACCPDCQSTVAPHELYHCQACGRDVCDECMGMCDVCECSCCRSCLAYDSVSRRECCPDCREHCALCRRIVAADDLDATSRRCPDCLGQRHSSESQLPTEDLTRESELSNFPDPSAPPSPSAQPATAA